jgi:hypothetical protein
MCEVEKYRGFCGAMAGIGLSWCEMHLVFFDVLVMRMRSRGMWCGLFLSIRDEMG